MKRSSLIFLILLFTYCISLIPSLVFHNHTSLSHQEIIDIADNHVGCSHESKNNHEKTKEYCYDIDCSHERHFSQLKDVCFLCSNCTVFEHNSNIWSIDANDSSIINQLFLYHKKIYLKEVSNDNNKSPPTLV